MNHSSCSMPPPDSDCLMLMQERTLRGQQELFPNGNPSPIESKNWNGTSKIVCACLICGSFRKKKSKKQNFRLERMKAYRQKSVCWRMPRKDTALLCRPSICCTKGQLPLQRHCVLRRNS